MSTHQNNIINAHMVAADCVAEGTQNRVRCNFDSNKLSCPFLSKLNVLSSKVCDAIPAVA
jgi:hypothetical protein